MQALFAARRFNREVNIICIENKVMYKALYFFNSILVRFIQTQNSLVNNMKRTRVIVVGNEAIKEV